MNELQEYTASIPDSNPNKAELIKQWKIENKWGQQEAKEVIETPVKEVKTNGAAETDAAVVPTPEASESSDSGSGELVSQEIKPGEFQVGMTDEQLDATRNYQKQYENIAKTNEIYSPENDTHEYKFSVNDQGGLDYLTRKKGEKDFIKASDFAEFSIANTFGHLNEDQKKEFEAYQEQLKKIQEEPGTVTLIETDPEKKNLAVRTEDGGFYVPQKELPKASTEDAMKNFEKRTGKKPSSLMELADEDYIIQDPTLLENSVTESLMLQNKQKVVQIRETLKGIKSNTYRALSSLSRVPTFINEMIFTTIADDKTLELYNSLDTEKRQKILNKMVGVKMPVDNSNIVNYLQDVSTNFKQKSDAINETMVQYDNTIGDLFGEGFKEGDTRKIWDATVRMSSEALKSIPSLVQAMVPYIGIGSIVAGESAASSLEKQEEGEGLSGKLNVNSLIHGASEGILETVTRGIAKKAFKAVPKESKEQAIKSVTQMAIQIAKDFGLEGLSESATLTINNLADSAVLGDEKAWEGYLSELIDTFLIGGALGGKIAATGAAKQVITQTSQANQVNRVVKDADLNNVTELYITPKATENSIKLSQNPVAKMALDKAVQAQVDAGEISVEKGDEIKNNFRQTEGAVNTLTKLDIGEANQPVMVDLMIEQKKLKNTIKQVDNSSLTKAESERLSEIDKELNGIIVADKTAKVEEGAKVIAEQVGTGFETFENEADVASAIETLKEQGGNIDTKSSEDYGTFVVMPDGKRIIILNKESAAQDNVMTTAQHEVGHAVLFETVKNKPEAAIALGTSLLEELKNSKDITFTSSKFLDRFNQYVEDADISKADTMEEVLTLASEGLSNGDIVFNEKATTKIGDFIRRALSAMGLNVKFKTGKDVLNFVRDYNRSVQKGKGLSKGLEKAATKGAEVDIKVPTDVEAEVADVVAKESKKDTGAIASTKVQEIYDTQGEAGAFDIIEQFKPIVSRIVEKRSEAPNFDRQLLTDEIETGKRGIFDLIKEYKPESGVPLAAYINKFLPARAIEASQRVLGEEFTSDVTEAKNVMAEEVETEIATKTTKRKIKPSSLISSDAVGKIKEQVQEKIKGIDPKNLTFKKLGDLAPEIIAAEIGIPVKKLTVATANLSKGDATAIQQFVNKNADKLLKILPEGAVVEAATEKLLGTSTGVPKGLLNAFYTKQARLGKGAGLAPFKLNKGISKADFLEAFGIIEGKKAEGFDARSPQAQALKGIASLYGKLVTNEIVRSDTDLSLEAKQDVAAGKNKAMASKRLDAESKTGKITGRTLKNYTVKQLNDLGFKSLGDVKEFLGLPLLPARTINGKKRDADKKIPLKSGYKILGGNLDLMTDAINTFLKEYPQYREIIRKSTTSSLGRSSMGSTKIFDRQIPKSDQVYEIITRDPYKDNKRKLSKPFVKKTNEKDFLKDQYAKLEYLENYWLDVQSFINKNPNLDFLFEQMLDDAQNDMGSLMRISPPILYLPLNSKGEIDFNVEIREEHNMPQNNVGSMLLAAAINGDVKNTFKIVSAAYMQGPLTMTDDNKVNVKYGRSMPDFFWDVMVPRILSGDLKIPEGTASLIRLVESDINLDNYKFLPENKTFSEYFFGTNGLPTNIQKKLLKDFFSGDITLESARKQGLAYSELAPGMSKASKRNNEIMPKAIEYNRDITVPMSIDALEKTDKALLNGRKLDQPIKKIRVFDFDDTLARTKSNVLYTMPDGTTGAIDAATFAKEAGNMEAEGAQWDFSEFSKVMEGSKGPLLDVAKIIADKRGTKDVFVLTARPADAAGPIKEFLASMGLDIPLANITGLGDGTPQAKAGWIMGKAAEGYNDFYFADDHTGNVKAVKDVLSQIDVKSKVQLAKASKRQTFDTIVNDMIEDSSGIETYKNYSAARAKTVGANKGKFNFFIPPSAEDFTGLLYKMLGKGKKGDAQMAFLKANLLDPYDRAESAVTQAKISAANDFKALKTELKTLPTSLSVPTGIGGFTYSHAVRTAIWTAQGMEIPGLSKRDIQELNDFVQNDPELRVFANELIKIQKGKPYPKPGKDWLGGNITSDIINDINKVNRAEYQQEWRENVDIIFSEDNMNKMEAAYGTRWREAMEDSLRRMKSGSNRPPGGNRATDGILDWLNNSVGAVMFLNTRSALLQTISAVNFINWGDNNIVKAGAAFANQKQFWSDFMTLMNSDYLVERRNGLKINVSESEIADAVRDSGNKVKSAIAFLLSKGFVMTRFADSFAIATGGSTFYRNRVKALVAKGMEQKAAEAQAFSDFRQIAEESQQSSNPNKISAQQASAAGRVILAWANTPMQYARIQKRSAQDLINGRGDWRTNVSKIVYYGAIQNLIFNSLQQAVFALGFGEDDEDEDAKKNEKISRVANGMIDSQLKGLGIGGAAVLALKSTLMELGKQHAKKRPEYDEAVFDLLNFSPPLGSKVQKIRGGLRSFSWNKKDMKEKGFSLDNPSYLAGAQVVTGLTNVPLDRVAKKINNVRGIVNEESALWQKVALGLGWSTWDVGLGYYGGFDAAKVLTAEEEKVKEIDDMKKLTKTKEQVDMLLDLGLSKKEIKALGKEQNRVEKIIELQNAEAEPKKEAEVKEEIKEETKPTPVAKPKPTPKPKVKTVSAEARLRRQFDSIKDENKPDQVKTLLKFGLSKKEIRALKYEKNRVEKILELMKK